MSGVFLLQVVEYAYSVTSIIFLVRIFLTPARNFLYWGDGMPWHMKYMIAMVLRYLARRAFSENAQGFYYVSEGFFLILLVYFLIHARLFESLSWLYSRYFWRFQILHVCLFLGSLYTMWRLWPSMRLAYWSQIVAAHEYFLIPGMVLALAVIAFELSVFQMRWRRPRYG